MQGMIIQKMKKLLSILIILLLTSFCSAQDFHFSIAPKFSLTYGELNELLYTADGKVVNSELVWEQKPLFDIGLEAKADYKNLLITAAFDFSLPLGTSHMYDSDWDDGEKWSFTEHQIEYSKSINTEGALGYRFKATPEISIIPQVQFNYIYSAFEAGKGSGVRDGRDIRTYGIDYSRHSFMIFTGLQTQAQLTEKFSIEAGFFTAPWIYQKGYDYHHGVTHPYSTEDYQTGHFSKFKASLSAEFFVDSIFSIEIFSDALFGFVDKGEIEYDEIMSLYHENQSGANIQRIRTGLAVRFSF